MWTMAKISDLCAALQYGYTASAVEVRRGPRFLRITDIQDGAVAWTNVPYCEIEKDQIGKYLLHPGDIVFARTGGTVGKSYIISSVPEPSIFASYLIRLTAHSEVYPKYLYYFFQSAFYWEQIGLKKGGLQGNVNATTLSSLEIPVCPLNEQRRLVATIEELLSELDKGVDALNAAREQLNAYRQSVLKDAFAGNLTKAWRSRHPDKTSAPEEQLAAIRAGADLRFAEVEKNSREALHKWQASGKKGSKPTKPHAHKVIGNPEIPSHLAEHCTRHWAWLRLGDVSEVTGGLTKNPKRSALPMAMKYLRVANVYADRLELDDIAEIGVTKDEFESIKLQRGDLLVVEGNGSVDQIGRVAMWGGEIEEVGHQNHLIRVRVIAGMSPRFFLSFLMSPLGRELIMRQASSTSGLHTLSISKVSGLPVPVPSREEQEVLLAALAAPMSEIETFAEEIETGLAKCATLRQAIFKKAFSGQLVAQYPGEESASALLERIHAERESGTTKKERTTKNARKKAA
jgi:type I restriction enzyme, S subunit